MYSVHACIHVHGWWWCNNVLSVKVIIKFVYTASSFGQEHFKTVSCHCEYKQWNRVAEQTLLSTAIYLAKSPWHYHQLSLWSRRHFYQKVIKNICFLTTSKAASIVCTRILSQNTYMQDHGLEWYCYTVVSYPTAISVCRQNTFWRWPGTILPP